MPRLRAAVSMPCLRAASPRAAALPPPCHAARCAPPLRAAASVPRRPVGASAPRRPARAAAAARTRAAGGCRRRADIYRRSIALRIEKVRRTQMQVLSRSFLRLLRGSSTYAATAPAPTHRRLSYHLLFLSAPPPPLSRRVSPPLSSPVRHASLTTLDPAVDGKRDAPEETSDSDSDLDSQGPCDLGIDGGVVPLLYRLPKSRHRDGSLYRAADRGWKKEYRIADRSETRLEAMKLSNSPYCRLHADGTCYWHPPGTMMQIFSLKLAKIHVGGGSVELYGYIAMRDRLDPLLNHVINFSRDDPVVVNQGSVINMTGPNHQHDWT
ncbi:hypothetical protein U9M48_021741 [Paspalum notatum var. saurae]|uniref:DUF6598 domain-containing protein n=1 Tax=Paspalum notatum var. saurae TaxID=547442 RepID=A0AAQ3WU31_PASNO